MLKQLIHKNHIILLTSLLLMSSSVVAKDGNSITFNPFNSSNEANAPPTAKNFEETSPIIPQVAFNNNDISMVFQIISDATGWSIFPTSEVNKAKINLWAKNISAEELLDKVVTTAGFVYHKEGNHITVMTYDEYIQLYGLNKKVVPLKYADATSVNTVIKTFLTKLGKSVVHKEKNTIILLESTPNLETITSIIEKLDTPAEEQTVIEVIDIKYADAEVLAETLSKVFSNKDSTTTSGNTQKEKERGTSERTNQQKEKEPSPASNEPSAKTEAATESTLSTPQSEVGVYSVAQTNQLIVKTTQNDIEKLKKLVAKLDTYAEPMTKNYHFTYVDAAEIYKGLEQILGISGRTSNYNRSGGQTRRNNERQEGIALVGKTNSILVTGQPSVHRIMTSIVESIDAPSTYEEGMIRIYKLENADVEEVAATIRELVQSTEKQKDRTDKVTFSEIGRRSEPQRSPRATRSGTPAGDSSNAQASTGLAETEEFIPQVEARVSTSKSANSVIVQTTARQHCELEKLVTELDKRRKQVLIKAMIIEIITSANQNVGVELNHTGKDGLAFTSFGLSTNLNPATGIRNIIVSPGGTAAVLKPDNIQAILHALESNQNAKITSAPQILVNDNTAGVINSIAEEPTTQINQGQTTTTTSFAGFVTAGTQFTIIPHISEKNYLRVEYQIVLNSFGAKSTDLSIPPPRNTSSIQSEATVPNGFTIIVGGLQATDETKNVSKVPLLGDIPVIGWVFGNTATEKRYKTTYLFITPTILENEDFADLKGISQKTMQDAELNGSNPTSSPTKMEDAEPNENDPNLLPAKFEHSD